MHTAQELVACVEGLWSLPDAYYRVRDALDDPDISTDDLAKLISTDPGMSVSLLRLANSAFFGFSRRIDTLSRAISLIGLDQVSEVLLASALAANFSALSPPRMNMHRFWRASVRRALLCRNLARARSDRDGERLFVAGLLAEAGRLVMYHAIPDTMHALQADNPPALAAQAERERDQAGCDYTEVGAALCAAWRLPPGLGTLIGAQLVPTYAGELARDAALLHVAATLSEGAENDEAFDATLSRLHPEALFLSGIPEGGLSPASTAAAAELDGVLVDLGLKR